MGQWALLEQLVRQIATEAGAVQDEVGQRALLFPGPPDPLLQFGFVSPERRVEGRRVRQHQALDVTLDVAENRVE